MPTSYDSLDIDRKLVWNFRDIGHTMRHISESRGSQRRILAILIETEPMTQSELTQQLNIQPGSVSEVLGKLEAAGLIVRTPSEADRRTTDLHLTPEGRTAAEGFFRQRKARHAQMFECLSPEEKAGLLSLLEKVNASWEEKYRQSSSKGKDCRRQHCP